MTRWISTDEYWPAIDEDMRISKSVFLSINGVKDKNMETGFLKIYKNGKKYWYTESRKKFQFDHFWYWMPIPANKKDLIQNSCRHRFSYENLLSKQPYVTCVFCGYEEHQLLWQYSNGIIEP